MVFKGFYNIRELQGRINLRIAIHWMLFARFWNDASDGLYLLLGVIPLKNNTKPFLFSFIFARFARENFWILRRFAPQNPLYF